MSEVVDQSPLGGISDDIVQDEVEHPDVTVKATSGDLENESLVENDKLSEGDDDYYQEFHDMFHKTSHLITYALRISLSKFVN